MQSGLKMSDGIRQGFYILYKEREQLVKMQLHENWQLCNVKEQEWVPAQVPGDIYMALLQAGKMEDPFWKITNIRRRH